MLSETLHIGQVVEVLWIGRWRQARIISDEWEDGEQWVHVEFVSILGVGCMCQAKEVRLIESEAPHAD